MSKKALIITYYWPPAGGPGVQRWLKFVKYLPEYNIKPIVYCPKNASYPIQDNSLKNEVSKDTIILKQPITEPYKWAKIFSKKNTQSLSKGIITDNKSQNLIEKLLLFIRGNFFIPDARIAWVKASVNYLKNYIEKEAIDTVITTGPPHSIHLIGKQLKQKFSNIKWIADFRDPWTTIGYHKALKLTRHAAKKHKKLEHEVLNTADKIIVTSQVTKTEFLAITNKPIHVITNGFDVAGTTVSTTLDTSFSLAHIGSLLSKRDPIVLWQVLQELVNTNAAFAKVFKLRLVGYVSNVVLKSIKDYGIENYIEIVGYVDHEKAISFQKKSQVLLLIEIDSKDTRCIIPGKLFEYMASKRPILAFGPKGSDVEQIIKTTKTGHYFLYTDFEALKNTILTHFNAYKKEQLKTNPVGLKAYSRKQLTQDLADIISA